MMQINRSWAVFRFFAIDTPAPRVEMRSPVSGFTETSPENAEIAAPAMDRIMTRTHKN